MGPLILAGPVDHVMSMEVTQHSSNEREGSSMLDFTTSILCSHTRGVFVSPLGTRAAEPGVHSTASSLKCTATLRNIGLQEQRVFSDY